jgi:PTH1 family peptidyl-tRNA hydrolase
MTARWLVIGLGNSGSEYEKTRHNIGQLLLAELSNGGKFSAHKSRMEICEIRAGENTLVLAKSRGFMNETGGPAKSLVDFYKVPIEQIIVAHDELDLPFNALRLKLGGGDNGHNGLKSLTSSLGGPDYYRIRMGIGRPQGEQDPADFVLKQFASSEKKELPEFITRCADAVLALVGDGLEKAQTKFNN